MGRHSNRNSEGFDDPTACGAINRADREIDYRRFKKTMRDLCNEWFCYPGACGASG